MTCERTGQAVRNNAIWCDTVCRVHGRPGEFRDAIWINRHTTPQFYPNAATLTADRCAEQLRCIQDLVDAGMPGRWSVKDSFATLDLRALGFRILFEAQWIFRSASLPTPDGRRAALGWRRLVDAAALADWEAAWAGEPIGRAHSSIFLPPLLADQNVAVIAAFQNQRIVAGAIANRAAEMVGLSNVFVPTGDAERSWAGCIAAAIEAFPNLPLVGYEMGRDLAIAGALGFETLGPLRIWVRANAAASAATH